MPTLISGYPMLWWFQKCIDLLISNNFERKYIVAGTAVAWSRFLNLIDIKYYILGWDVKSYAASEQQNFRQIIKSGNFPDLRYDLWFNTEFVVKLKWTLWLFAGTSVAAWLLARLIVIFAARSSCLPRSFGGHASYIADTALMAALQNKSTHSLQLSVHFAQLMGRMCTIHYNVQCLAIVCIGLLCCFVAYWQSWRVSSDLFWAGRDPYALL